MINPFISIEEKRIKSPGMSPRQHGMFSHIGDQSVAISSPLKVPAWSGASDLFI